MRYVHITTYCGCEMPGLAKAMAAEALRKAARLPSRRPVAVTTVGRYVDSKAPALVRRIRKALAARAVRVASLLRARYHTLGITQKGDLAKAADPTLAQLIAALESDDLGKDVSDIVSPEMLAAYRRAASVGLTQVGLAETPDLTKQMDEAARAFAAARGGELIKDLAGTTDDDLRDLLARAVEEGMSADDLSAAVMDLGAFGEARADMIGRTELAFAHVQGNLAGWRASDEVEGKQWVLGDNHSEPDECDDAADVGVVGLEEEFIDGIEAPPAHPRCVCLLPDVPVWGPQPKAATKTLYEGEVVVIRTASGNELSVTTDHPILTDGGFVLACDLHRGSSVVCCSDLDPILPIYQNEQHRPSSAKDVFDSISANASISVTGRVVTAYLDQQWSPSDTKVSTISADPELSLDANTARLCQRHEDTFISEPIPRRGHVQTTFCMRLLPPILRQCLALFCAGSRLVSRFNLGLFLFRACLTPPCGRVLALNGCELRALHNVNAPLRINNGKAARQRKGAILRPPTLTDDLRNSLPGAIFSDEVVSVRRGFFCGHVYNFQTTEMWYCAGGIITHNCDILPVLRAAPELGGGGQDDQPDEGE